MSRSLLTVCPGAFLGLILGLLVAAPAQASDVGRYHFPPGGRIQGLRAADVNGDGRPDLVALLEREEDGVRRQELLVLRTPATPRARTLYGEEDAVRIRLDEGVLATAGAVAVGRFGPDGSVRLRFLGRDGLHDLEPSGAHVAPEARLETPTLLGRSPDRPLVFWDQHGDLDGDGVEELWFPLADGAVKVLSGRAGASRRLALQALSRGVTDAEHLLRRHAYIPHLMPADLDGDGRRELVAYEGGRLVVWGFEKTAGEGLVAPLHSVVLPFVKERIGPDEVHTPRLQLLDADGDGTTDLLVTLVTGNRRQLGSFRTRLLHFPGPFVTEGEDGEATLVATSVRIDTESVALHPKFVDVDGDGALDYVSDSIRGTKLDMIKRVLGQDPTIWYVAFRFSKASGTFDSIPYFGVERPYSRTEAVGNLFGRTGFLEGDFDADGHKDLLDLGNLAGIEILKATPKRGRGPGDPVSFEEQLLKRLRIPKPLVADALVIDLQGDGGADAVLWNEESMFFLVTKGPR